VLLSVLLVGGRLRLRFLSTGRSMGSSRSGSVDGMTGLKWGSWILGARWNILPGPCEC
jgi:hypothetical protein